jgi:hypothetical protein
MSKIKKKGESARTFVLFKPGTKVSSSPIVLLFFRQKMKNIEKEVGEEEVLPGVKRIILVLSGTMVVGSYSLLQCCGSASR